MTAKQPAIVPSASEWIKTGDHFVTSSGHRIFFRRVGNGPSLIMLHGFPTWSYDYAETVGLLSDTFDITTFDFLGYGASAKPPQHHFTVAESADIVIELLAHLKIREVILVIHNYGGIVGQELLDRNLKGTLNFKIAAVDILNCGIVFSQYRPTFIQKILATPLLGRFVASRISRRQILDGLNSVRGSAKLDDAQFSELWAGMSREDGHKLAHLLIRYNTERAQHHSRWEDALAQFNGPMKLIWGLDDPVSGKHVLDAAREVLPHAQVLELPGVGHFPQSEAPGAVAAAIRAHL